MIALIFGGLTVKWDHNFKLKRDQLRDQGKGNSLGEGELRKLLQDTVLDAIAPMEDRLDLIEMHMRQLPEGVATSKVLDESDSIDSSDE